MKIRTALAAALLLAAPALHARAEDPGAAVATIIPELDKGHHDKLKLAGYVLDFRFGSSNEDLKDFCKNMRDTQDHLARELEHWAKTRGVSTHFSYGHDIMDKVRERLESDEGDALQAAKGDDFKLHVLADMEQDYMYQMALVKTLRDVDGLDGDLKNYLDESYAAHKAGLKQIETLLARFRYP